MSTGEETLTSQGAMTMPSLPTAARLSITENSIILYLSLGRLRTRRSLASSAVTTDIDPSLLSISKTILESPELEAIQVADNDLRTWIRARCLPSPFKGKGIMLLPVRLIEPVMARIEAAQAARLPLIDTFMATYAQRKAEAQPKLASGFDSADYPPDEAVRGTFTFETQIFEMNAPGKLKAINRELFMKESVKIDNMWSEASRTVSAVLLEEFRKLTGHMADRLAPGADGKQKRFHDTAVKKLAAWTDLFQARNLGNDDELVAYVEKARKLIAVVDPENIRDSDDLRNGLAKEFTAITAALDEKIINAPIRAIDLDEESS